ncbi:MAG: barstar family protein [Oscillospiraceae bacterium]|nr:barstar family protein [Oscillospiraceae bacterium]
MRAIINGTRIKNRKTLHNAFARQLSLPEWYGRNLDALYDCLSEITEDSEIILRNPSLLRETFGTYAQMLETVLRDVCDENPHLRLTVEKDREPKKEPADDAAKTEMEE